VVSLNLAHPVASQYCTSHDNPTDWDLAT